jgi:transglutaminase-like putative cysteine protease
LISPATVFTARGVVAKDKLDIVYGPEGQSARMELPLTDPLYLPSTLRPRVLAGDAAPGTRYTVPVFSPLTMRNEPMTVIVEGSEPVTNGGAPVATIRVAEEYAGLRTHAWLEPSGAVVREEAALGFVLERETRERALTEATATAPVDLVGVSRIPLDGEIPDPRAVSRLSLRVTGAARDHVPDDPPRQRMRDGLVDILREDVPAAGAAADGPPAREYTAPAPFIESDDAAIVARARAIVGDVSDRAEAARRLVAWVASHVEKAPSVTVPSAREVLSSLRGDCNEHAVLLTALARAAGIPARVVAGAVYANDGFYYHAWTEVWLGRWVSADAVFDQLPADATHVKLVEGGPERHIALAGTIGQLAFRIEEVR